MKITVLNGSPKGELSVTMQYVKYIMKKFPRHDIDIVEISSRIKKIEDDEKAFGEIIERVRASDGVIWGVPLYVFLVPSQYKRFIELVSERNAAGAFAGKYAAVITTSIHFFDHTAHNYMRAVCEDLGMNFAGSFSPDMYDIMKEEERENLVAFADAFFESIERKAPATRMFAPLVPGRLKYKSGPAAPPVDAGDRRVVIVTDAGPEHKNLAAMTGRLALAFGGKAVVANINDVKIKGGCLGCCQCGPDYQCVYGGGDGFIDFYNATLRPADIIVYAGSIVDRYLSSGWKRVFDRSFFNTHTPTLMGKQIGFLVSGPLRQIPNLREIMQAYVEWQHANLVDIVTDEYDSSHELDRLIDGLAGKLVSASQRGFVSPATFLGVGGMKIFRDDIWGRLRFVFQADHRFYEKHGFYDFPQKDRKVMAMNRAMIAAMKNPDARDQIRKMFKTEMVKPHRHIVETK